jgi:hypothetical protein
MKILKIISILLFVGGIALAGAGVYLFFNNEEEARANSYSAEQNRLLAEAFRAKGTPRERELIKEYEGMKGLVEDAWRYARRTRQTAMLVVGAGLVLTIAPLAMLIISSSRKRRASSV